ncbi:MAG: alpha/beta fold hydrolase [Granulosicoccus sp.]
MNVEYQPITVRGNDDYPLICRYWQAEHPQAILVLLHGIVSHSGWLESITNELASNGISCLAADRRGAGLNNTMRGDAPDSNSLLSDLAAVLDWAHVTGLPCHLAGFCWGANYAVNYMVSEQCLNHNVKLQSLSLLAPSLFPSKRITEQPFETGDSSVPDQEPVMPIKCFTDGPAFEAFIKPDPLRLTHVSTRMNQIMAEFSQGIWMKFLRLKIPTLVVLGAEDEVVDNAATEQLFNRLPCDPKAIHSLRAKHGLQFDSPDEVIQLVLQWVLKSS